MENAHYVSFLTAKLGIVTGVKVSGAISSMRGKQLNQKVILSVMSVWCC
jgi:hypothetical protein